MTSPPKLSMGISCRTVRRRLPSRAGLGNRTWRMAGFSNGLRLEPRPVFGASSHQAGTGIQASMAARRAPPENVNSLAKQPRFVFHSVVPSHCLGCGPEPSKNCEKSHTADAIKHLHQAGDMFLPLIRCHSCCQALFHWQNCFFYPRFLWVKLWIKVCTSRKTRVLPCFAGSAQKLRGTCSCLAIAGTSRHRVRCVPELLASRYEGDFSVAR